MIALLGKAILAPAGRVKPSWNWNGFFITVLAAVTKGNSKLEVTSLFADSCSGLTNSVRI